MTWENTARARRRAKRQADWHQTRIDAAPTSKKRLSAACQWLVSEAWRTDQLHQVLDQVLDMIHQLRAKEARHDRDDHNA